MRRSLCMTAAILIAAGLTYPKTPQQIKADLASIMPAGKKGRLVWERGTVPQTYAGKVLYVVDSDSGVIRQLTPTSIDAAAPQLTADGSRVVFMDQLSGKIMVINWDGSGMRTVNNSGFLGEYWQDPTDKSDWAINTQGSGGATRISIDLPKREVPITQLEISYGSGCGLSPDGTHFAGWFHLPGDIWRPGTVTVPGGVLTHGDIGGCGMGIAPDDNSYDYFQHLACSYAMGHQGILIENGNQAVQQICLTQSILTWASSTPGAENSCHDKSEFHTAKWTNLRNFVTFTMFNTMANPFIVRISDLKWISIEDTAGCYHCDGLEVCFYTPSGTAVDRGYSKPDWSFLDDNGRLETYGVDGRRIAVSYLRMHNRHVGGVVVIRRMQARDRSAVNVALVP